MSESNLPITLHGITLPFAGNGRKIGYPTANIIVPTDLPDGVYFGFADIEDFYDKRKALIFIGTPSSATVSDVGRRVEAHLLDIPDEDYYGLKLTVTVRQHHRGNKTFQSLQELLDVMKADETAAREWFKEHRA